MHLWVRCALCVVCVYITPSFLGILHHACVCVACEGEAIDEMEGAVFIS